MNLESDFGIDAKQSAAIADYFRVADTGYALDSKAFDLSIMGGYQERFGDLNFAVLETIFREMDFFTYHLAIPTEVVASKKPELIAVNVNQQLRGAYVEMPFAAMRFPTKDGMLRAASSMGIIYDKKQNLKNLGLAGVLVERPATIVYKRGDPRLN